MAVLTPIKPKITITTDQDNLRLYTIHSNKNRAFGIKISEKYRTSIVSFKRWDDAFFISKMIETNFISKKEWPMSEEDGTITLPMSAIHDDILRAVYIQEWDFNDLKLLCTSNFLDMISVDEIVTKKAKHMFQGHILRFEAPIEFYQARLERFINII